ncbi:MAG: hypothetical protein HYY38_05770 [Rhodospirillales bacterium]|nr:hypothetical protein [Rhodospirillales bacterium]
MFALMLPILIGFIGLGVEVGLWYKERRDLQAAADAAALAGAYELAEDRASNIETVARREAENNGWTDCAGGCITIRSSPFNGTFPAAPSAYSADAETVQVALTRQVSLLFAGYFLGSGNSVTINTKAVGKAVAGATTACVLALGSGNPSGALTVSGASNSVTMSGCTMATNSTNANAVKNLRRLSGEIESAGGNRPLRNNHRTHRLELRFEQLFPDRRRQFGHHQRRHLLQHLGQRQQWHVDAQRRNLLHRPRRFHRHQQQFHRQCHCRRHHRLRRQQRRRQLRPAQHRRLGRRQHHGADDGHLGRDCLLPRSELRRGFGHDSHRQLGQHDHRRALCADVELVDVGRHVGQRLVPATDRRYHIVHRHRHHRQRL